MKRFLILLGIVTLLVGCRATVPARPSPEKSSPALAAGVRSSIERADGKIAQIEPEVQDRPKLVVLATEARKDLAEALGGQTKLEKQLVADQKREAKKDERIEELEASDDVKKWLKVAAFICIAGGLALIALGVWKLGAAAIRGGAIAFALGILMWAVATYAKLLLAVGIVILAAVFIGGLWLAYEWWKSHRKLVQAKIKGVFT